MSKRVVISTNACSHALHQPAKRCSQQRKPIFAYPLPNLALGRSECEIGEGVNQRNGCLFSKTPQYTPPQISHSVGPSARSGRGYIRGSSYKLSNYMFPRSPKASKSLFPNVSPLSTADSVRPSARQVTPVDPK